MLNHFLFERSILNHIRRTPGDRELTWHAKEGDWERNRGRRSGPFQFL